MKCPLNFGKCSDNNRLPEATHFKDTLVDVALFTFNSKISRRSKHVFRC